MNDQVEISIIIVSYNTRDLITTCLDSIINIDDCRKEIFVVDNASWDGSAKFLRENYPDIHLVVNEENRGFAAASNQALQLSKGRYAFFLNPDIEFLPASFSPMISFMDAHPQIGLAGMKLINPDGTEQESFSNEYPGHKQAGPELSGLKDSIAWVLGASMLVRSDLLKSLGGFDESYFVYGEDQDLCLRIRRAGYEIGYYDAAILVHLGGQSERQTESAEIWKKKVRAEFIFYQKHYSQGIVQRIIRGQLIKAHWRIFTLRMLLPFCKNKWRTVEKLEKYKATRDVIKYEIMGKKGNSLQDSPEPAQE